MCVEVPRKDWPVNVQCTNCCTFAFRIALDLNAPPLETGTFGDADVRPEDLQEVLAKAPMPSSDSGAGSLHADCDEPWLEFELMHWCRLRQLAGAGVGGEGRGAIGGPLFGAAGLRGQESFCPAPPNYGYSCEVCWVNENGELGLPFDLILSGMEASLQPPFATSRRLFRNPGQGGSLPTLRSDERSVQGELAAELLDAALHGKGRRVRAG